MRDIRSKTKILVFKKKYQNSQKLESNNLKSQNLVRLKKLGNKATQNLARFLAFFFMFFKVTITDF
ncbi:hypothetical protein [Helicobacter sp. T3_23-1059]